MPQQIDVPGMGIVEFPDGMDDNAIAAAIQSNMPAPEKPFLEKLGTFARKVYENPPPFLGGLATLPKRATEAAQELTWGADPQAAEQAAGTMLEAAGAATPMAPRGTGGIFARPTAPAGTPMMPPPTAARPSAVDPALAAAGRLGVDIPRYLATESTAIPQLAAGIKNVPMAGQPIVTSAERLTEQLGTAKQALGAGTAETAGERAKSGLTGFIKTGSQRPVSEAYRAVDELIDPAVRVPLDNTRAMVGEIMAERTAARIPGRSKAVETVFDAVQDPAGMDYRGTKGLRSFLGEKSPQELAVSGLAPTEVKRLYGALTKDLGAVVRESSPEAFGRWQEANALARLTNMQRTALSKVTGAAGDAAPEAVFNRLVGYAQSKGGADLARLRLAKRAMGPDAWGDVGSALIQRLGQAPDGQFSAQRFVTAFGNMAPAARNELFSGQQHAALQDLFTVSQYVKDRIGRFENVSGTSRGMFGGGMLTGALADPISIIGGMVGTRLLAEALARPAVVRAASAVTRAQMRGNPVATRRALQQLYNIALRAGLISAAQQPIERRQAGGPVEEGQPYLVGEAGPEVFVPDDPWARAAARTGRRGRREGAGTAFVEGGYGIPAAYRALDKGAQEAFESAGKLQHYGDAYYDPAPVVQQAIGAVGAPLVGPAMKGAVLGSGAIRPIRAYHGSPHDFERFDLSKIGTGEGAQAYGHGLYFAENPAVAQSYKMANAPIYQNTHIANLAYEAQRAAEAATGLRGEAAKPAALKWLQDEAERATPYQRQKFHDAINNYDAAMSPPTGRMYEVNINAAPEHFLDWDKPLMEQHPNVLNTVADIAAANRVPLGNSVTGEAAYRRLDVAGDPNRRIINPSKEAATAALREAGIPGIKYLDQGSRGVPTSNGRVQALGGKFHIVDDFGTQAGPFDTLAEAQQYLKPEGRQTSNYVLFRDDIIDIVKKYGLAGAATMLGIGKDEARAAMGRARPKED